YCLMCGQLRKSETLLHTLRRYSLGEKEMAHFGLLKALWYAKMANPRAASTFERAIKKYALLGMRHAFVQGIVIAYIECTNWSPRPQSTRLIAKAHAAASRYGYSKLRKLLSSTHSHPSFYCPVLY